MSNCVHAASLKSGWILMEVARPEVPGELPPQLLEGQHVLSHVAVGASV